MEFEFTDRMVKGRDDVYRWYYDVRYGQDDTFMKVIGIVLGSLGAIFMIILIALPDNGFKLQAGAILFGTMLFAALLAWVINKVMYMRRGGKYRIRYEMDSETLRALYDSGSSSTLQKMGGVVAAAGVLSGNIGGALTGAGMAGAAQGAELPLKQIRSITVKPRRDYIMIHTLVQHSPIYVSKEDIQTLEEWFIAHSSHSVIVKER